MLGGRQDKVLFSQKAGAATWVIPVVFLCVRVVHYIPSNLIYTISSVSECTNSSAFCCGLFV